MDIPKFAVAKFKFSELAHTEAGDLLLPIFVKHFQGNLVDLD